MFFFFNDTATTEIYTLSLHDALPIFGIGSTILDGAVIHSNVLLGAGSLVSEGKELESGCLYIGTPAKRIRELTDEEIAWFEYSAKHYQNLKNNYLLED